MALRERPLYAAPMHRFRHVRTVLLALMLCAVFGAVAPPGRADQTDPRLDALFEQLRNGETLNEVGHAEQQIWRIWLSSGEDEIDALFMRGARAMGTGRFAEAQGVFDLIIARRPDMAEGWNKRATVRYLMGDYWGSIADIDETLKREPRHFGALYGLGLCYLGLGDKEAALDAFVRTLAVHPQSPNLQRQIEQLSDDVKGPGI